MSFFDDASLAFLPSGAAGKDGKAYSIKPTDGTGDFTFSRGSNLAATRVGADGLIEKGRENLLLQSNNFDTTTWVKSGGITLTSGQSGYDGSSDAWLVERSAAYNNIYQSNSSFFTPVSTISIYAKAGTYNFLRLAVAGVLEQVYFNLTDGSLGVNSDLIASSAQSVGNGWWRLSATFQDSSASGIYIQPVETDGGVGNAGTGSIYIQDAQQEIGLAATDVISTGATTGKAGLLEDEPRFDYSGGATCPSLLLEPSRTNIIPYSEYIEEVDLLGDAQILTTTDATPEGTNNARVLAYNGGSNQHYMSFAPSVTNGETYTFSVFLKKKELRYAALVFLNDYAGRFFDLETGTILGTTGGTLVDSKIEDFGNGWYRCSITDDATSTSKFSGIYLSPDGTSIGPIVPTSDDGVYVYGFQVEQGSYPTSYIPNNSGGSVTRGVDELDGAGDTNTFNDSEGVLFLDVENVNANSAISISDDSTSDFIQIYLGYQSSNPIRYRANSEGIVQFDTNFPYSLDVSQPFKVAYRYSANNFSIWINGVKADEVLSSSTPVGLSTIKFYNIFGALTKFDGKLNQALYFPEALSDADCITLTTL